jgi:hypothetical protein
VISPEYIPSESQTTLSNEEKRFGLLISTPRKRLDRTTDVEAEITEAIPGSSAIPSSDTNMPTPAPRRGKEGKDTLAIEDLMSSFPEDQKVDTLDGPLAGSISMATNGFGHEESQWLSSDDSEDEDFSGIEKDADDVMVVQRAYFEALLSFPREDLGHAISARHGDEEMANGKTIPVEETVLDNAKPSQDCGSVVEDVFRATPSVPVVASSSPSAGPEADLEPKLIKVRLCYMKHVTLNVYFLESGCSRTRY